jgi:hypothetical protein
MAWTTIAEALAITGVTVTAADLAGADEDVNMHAGITGDATVYDRDAHWLGRAVAWQAVWLAGQPGNAERSSVTTVSQEGLQAAYKDEAAVILAPRARRCLKNLSWMGSRSVRLGPARAPAESPASWYETSTSDTDPPDEYWTPMGGG